MRSLWETVSEKHTWRNKGEITLIPSSIPQWNYFWNSILKFKKNLTIPKAEQRHVSGHVSGDFPSKLPHLEDLSDHCSWPDIYSASSRKRNSGLFPKVLFTLVIWWGEIQMRKHSPARQHSVIKERASLLILPDDLYAALNQYEAEYKLVPSATLLFDLRNEIVTNLSSPHTNGIQSF